MRRYSWGVVLLVVGFAVSTGPVTRSHTPIASRWNYNEHLFPIFRDNCGSCHRSGGIAPMSLVTYQEAYPWAQSIREEVLGLRMPPWKAEDGFGDFKNGHALPAHEMDMILEWSSGGYPQGPRDKQPQPMTTPSGWSLGEPGLTLTMPEAFVLDAGTSETTRFFVLPSRTDAERWITGVDVVPGAGAVVRGVGVYVDASGAATALDATDTGLGFEQPIGQPFPTTPPIAVWSPGQQRVLHEGGFAHRLPAGADIVLRVHYKKTWITEGESFSDQTQVGLHFRDGDAAAIESMLVTSPAPLEGRDIVFTHAVERDVRLLAVLPEIDIEAKDIQVMAVTPNGDRVPMLFLREPDASWPTRYWFEAPLDLPGGTEIEIHALLRPGADTTPGTSLLGTDSTSPIRLLVDYASGDRQANDN